VNPQALTITANNATQTYNDVPYSGGNGVIYSGFVNGQNSSVLGGTIAYGGSSQGAVNAGTYAIIPSNQTSSNYAINYVGGTLTINKAPLTITANNATQTYNDVPYSGGNGVIYSGFVNGEGASVLGGTIAYGGSSQGAVNAGTYMIIPSNQTSSNYAINYVDGTLTINKAPLTVTANNQTKFVGEANPALTYRVINGTLFGTDSLFGTLARAPGEAVGSYAITRGTLAASSNYDMSFVGATLFIEVNSATTLISSPSLVITNTNNFPTLSSSGSFAAPPLVPSTGGAGIDVKQPRVRVVRSSDGRRIILEAVANPPR
jgi:MBG domain-containing protein